MTVTVRLVLALLLVTLGLATWTVSVFVDDVARRRTLARNALAETAGRPSLWHRAERLLFTRTPLRWFARKLAAAGLAWPPLLVMVALLSCMGAVLVGGPVLLGRIGAVALAAAVPMFFMTWLRRRADKRSEAFIAQLPELARIVANGNSAGLSMGRCLAMAGREMADPAGEELRRVANRLNLGWSTDRALTDLAGRLPSREIDVLVRTIVVQSRTGGALTDALMDISQALEERKELRREVATVILGSAVSGYAVILISVGAVIVLNLMKPGLLDLMASTWIGRVVIAISMGLFAMGFFLMRIVSRVEV